MCCDILEKRIQPEPFLWFGIPAKYNATHYALLNSADAEQARSHSKSNSQKERRPLARNQRISADAWKKSPAYCDTTSTAITLPAHARSPADRARLINFFATSAPIDSGFYLKPSLNLL